MRMLVPLRRKFGYLNNANGCSFPFVPVFCGRAVRSSFAQCLFAIPLSLCAVIKVKANKSYVNSFLMRKYIYKICERRGKVEWYGSCYSL